MAWKGADLFASPQPTNSVASIEVTTPIIARFAEDRRVRTLETAITNAARGAMTMSGTAHPSVVVGSKLKPDGRAPEAVPEAAVAIFATTKSRFSEKSPAPRSRPREPPVRARQRPPVPPPPGRKRAARRESQI